MIFDLSNVLLLEISETDEKKKDTSGNWQPTGMKKHSVVSYQFNSDHVSRHLNLSPEQLPHAKGLLGKYVNVTVDQRVFDNGKTSLTVVQMAPVPSK